MRQNELNRTHGVTVIFKLNQKQTVTYQVIDRDFYKQPTRALMRMCTINAARLREDEELTHASFCRLRNIQRLAWLIYGRYFSNLHITSSV